MVWFSDWRRTRDTPGTKSRRGCATGLRRRASLGWFCRFFTAGRRSLEAKHAGQLKEFTDELKVVLVDEYQDTNLMQEQLYFELADACAARS